MDSSDFLKKQEEDEDIKLFKEEYPEVYKFIVRLIDGQCDDKEIENFIDEYGEDVYDYIKKIADGELDDEEVRRLKEEYPEEIYVAIQKMVERKKVYLTEAKPQITPYKKGDFIGQKYEVYDVLGEGGFGIVYLVYSHELKSVFALKTFRDEYLENIATRERFKKEAQVWIDLERHPYLVRAYFVQEISGRLFIAMEHIAPDEMGLNTLEGYLRRRPPDLAQSLRWAIQFCYGMKYAYSKGIKAHRDIKPANIMIGQDKAVKISDFGLAGVVSTSKPFSGIKINPQRNISGEAYQTMEGTAFGTPPYMSPEQFENAAGCDERSDIYSFGIVLYQMASGDKLPFYPDISGDSANDIFQNWYMLHCKATIPKLKTPLFPIIQKCLEKEKRRRYQSFKELRADIELLLIQKTGEIIKPLEKKELEAWEWANKGVSLNILGKYEEAITCFNEVLQLNHRDTYALVGKGASFEFLGNYQEALDHYEQVLAIDTFHELAWNNKGTCLGRMGNHVEAISCFDSLLKINPQNAFAWNNKGTELAKLEKYWEALDCYDKAIELDLYYDNAWFNKGNNLVKVGKSIEALNAYHKVLEINPNHGRSWVTIGVIFKNNKEYQKAIACYDKALRIDPTNVNALELMSHAFFDIGKLQEALSCIEKALAIDSKQSVLWYSKGIVLVSLGKAQEAIPCFEKAIGINPRDAMAWTNKGFSLLNLGKPQEAIPCFDKALELNSRHAEAWLNKGVALVRLGKAQEAIPCFEKAIGINPRDAGAWGNKALAEDELNKTQVALISYKHFLRLASERDADLIAHARKRIEELSK